MKLLRQLEHHKVTSPDLLEADLLDGYRSSWSSAVEFARTRFLDGYRSSWSSAVEFARRRLPDGYRVELIEE